MASASFRAPASCAALCSAAETGRGGAKTPRRVVFGSLARDRLPVKAIGVGERRRKGSVFTTCSSIEEKEAETTEALDDLDSLEFVDLGGSVQNKDGAGATFVSPDWLTQLQRNWGGKSDIPTADAKVEDITELLGGGMFQPLYKWMKETGDIYLLPTGPTSSYVVVSDPAALKHILRTYGTQYYKGTIAEVAGGDNGPFGCGFALLEFEPWKIRRKAVTPGLHRSYIEAMVERVFVPCADILAEKCEQAAVANSKIEMEDGFCQVTLDVIGKAAFNYDFQSLTSESPLVQAVYTALKEGETRSMDVVPLWRLPAPIARLVSPRQAAAQDAIKLIRETVEELVARCKSIIEEEDKAGETSEFGPEYLNDKDPSLLRFLLASREEVSSVQLRDDLVSILIAGHETTGSVLTWMLYMLTQNPDCMKKIQDELDEVIGTDPSVKLTYANVRELKYLRRCIDETMRLYPQPPVYTRRSLVENEVPTMNGGTVKIPAQQDLLLSIYNMHRNPNVWDNPNDFIPERFGPLDQPPPTEVSTDYKYIPFGGGPRKCPGDQFALMEAMVVMSTLLRRFSFELTPNQTIGMTSGATIHTSNGMYVNVVRR